MSAAEAAVGAGGAAQPAEVRVWDPLVRLFHWGLVAAFATAWLSEEGRRLHEYAGYLALGLIAVRVLWGFIGTRHARFADFVVGPRAVLAYLGRLATGRAPRHLGHNPAGGAMVLALMALVVLTGLSGWLSTTDAFWGVEWVEEAHEALADLTLILVFAHVAGVIVTSLKDRENLVRAMITGRKLA